MKEIKLNYWKVASVVLFIAIIGLIYVGEVNKKENVNRLAISEKDMNNILSLADKNNWKGLQIVNLESGEGLNINLNEKCDEIHFGVCFDKQSEFYKCNLDKDQCDLKDWEIVNTMIDMKKNNLAIYGVSTCTWCKKQLGEFGDFVEDLINEGLYFECSKPENSQECIDVTYTPSWKKDGEVITTGYKPLGEIKGLY